MQQKRFAFGEKNLIDKLIKYLSPFGWKAIDVGIALMKFEGTHGKKCVKALERFIRWSEQHKKEIGWIAAQLGHDLNGCEDKTMSPRTAGY